ncbi:hypothetical protein P2P40_27840, partial [Escherichia coli]
MVITGDHSQAVHPSSYETLEKGTPVYLCLTVRDFGVKGTVAKLAMRQPFVLFKGLTFQKLC